MGKEKDEEWVPPPSLRKKRPISTHPRTSTPIPTSSPSTPGDPFQKIMHTWTPDEKSALVLLARWYANPWHEIAAVLNHAMRASIVPDFGASGMPKARMLSQWHTLTRRLRLDPVPELDVPWEAIDRVSPALHGRVLRAAVEVNILLRPRLAEDPAIAACIASRAVYIRPRSESFATEEDRITDWVGSPTSSPCPAPRPRNLVTRFKGPPPGEGGTVESIAPCTTKDVPKLLFRVWTDATRGVNGEKEFLAAKCVSKTAAVSHVEPDPLSGEFLDAVDRHIGIKPFESPFVSLTDSLIWCLTKAYQQRGLAAQIAIISGAALVETETVYHAAPVVKLLKARKPAESLTANVRRYQGAREYLAWNRVPGDALLGVIGVQDMERAIAQDVQLERFVAPRLIMKLCWIGASAVRRILQQRYKRADWLEMNGEPGVQVEKFARLITDLAFLSNGDGWREMLQQVILQNWGVGEEGDSKNVLGQRAATEQRHLVTAEAQEESDEERKFWRSVHVALDEEHEGDMTDTQKDMLLQLFKHSPGTEDEDEDFVILDDDQESIVIVADEGEDMGVAVEAYMQDDDRSETYTVGRSVSSREGTPYDSSPLRSTTPCSSPPEMHDFAIPQARPNWLKAFLYSSPTAADDAAHLKHRERQP